MLAWRKNFNDFRCIRSVKGTKIGGVLITSRRLLIEVIKVILTHSYGFQRVVRVSVNLSVAIKVHVSYIDHAILMLWQLQSLTADLCSWLDEWLNLDCLFRLV